MPDPRPSDPRPVDALTLEEAEAELARLAATLAEANDAYHAADAPVIDDADYDDIRAMVAEAEAAGFTALR